MSNVTTQKTNIPNITSAKSSSMKNTIDNEEAPQVQRLNMHP